MPYLYSLGKILVFLGVILIAAGGLFMAGSKLGFLGKLPGDIFVERGNFKLYFPLATMLLLSIILSLVINFIFRK